MKNINQPIHRLFMLSVALVASALLAAVPVQSRAQQTGISAEFKEASFGTVVKYLERNYGYNFTYKTEDASRVRPVTISAQNSSIRQVMTDVLQGSGLQFEVQNKAVIIHTAGRQQPQAAKASHTLAGRVTDREGQPVIGASVLVKGTLTGVTTDATGSFSISVPTDAAVTLAVSFLGYKNAEVTATPGKPVVVTLLEDMQQVDQVVVTGYQTIGRNESSGASKSKSADDIRTFSKPSIADMLAGQISGLAVMSTSGEPSATPKIRIRGTSSIQGTKSPLWVLDGIILEDPVRIDYTQLSGDDAAYLVGNAIAGVNPNDIESITVLKDAAASAIYGVQAANGVIVVTTKKGKAGEAHVSYNGNVSLALRDTYRSLDLMNATERIQLSQDIIAAELLYTRIPSDFGYEGLYRGYLNKDYDYATFKQQVDRMAERNTDWLDLLFRNAWSQSHSVSLSGGTDRTTYYASLGYNNNQGTPNGSQSKRYTANMKVNSWLGKNFFAGLMMNASINDNTGFHSSVNPSDWAYTTARTIPAFDDNGNPFFFSTSQTLGGTEALKERISKNYLYEMNNTGNEGKVTAVTAKLDLQWNIWQGLQYKFNGSIVHQQTDVNEWANERSNFATAYRGYNYNSPDAAQYEAGSILPRGGIISRNNQSQALYTLRNQLGYNRTFKGDHLVSVIAISEIRSVVDEGLAGTYYGWLSDRGQKISPVMTERYISALATASELAIKVTDNTKNYVSWIGSGIYSYKDKYVFNANVRMDGSNQFGENPSYRFLPVWSVSGKYIISKERFLQNNRVISSLAVRASYGLQGNVDKSTSPDLVIAVGNISSVTGLPESNVYYLPNKDLRWEKTRSYNFGVDFTLWDGRLSGTMDTYKKMGSDIIMVKQLSQVNGVMSEGQKINAGDMNNTGFEADLLGYPVKGKDFDFSIGLVYAYNKNVLVRANTGEKMSTDNAAKMVGGNAIVEGKAVGSIFSYPLAGLGHDNGMPYYYDKNGRATTTIDGQEVPNYSLFLNELGFVYSGVPTPPSSGGLRLNFRYKNLRLGGNFVYAFGGVNRLPALFAKDYAAAFDPMMNLSKELIGRWKNPGDEVRTNIPALFDSRTYEKLPQRTEYAGSGVLYKGIGLYDNSDARIAPSDNLRLNSLTLSYTMPARILSRMKIENMIFSLEGTNLMLIADKRWRGRDPEMPNAISSMPKTFTLNVNISF